MPTKANKIIQFLNFKSKEELEDLQTEDRTEIVIEVKRVLTKRGLMLELEERVQTMDVMVQRFFSKTESLQKKGLPSLFVINNKLITLSDYKKKILTMEKDGSKFTGIKGNIMGKSFLETLRLDLIIQQEIKYLFITKPTFTKYTETDEVYQRLLKVNIPSQQRWDDLCDLIN